VFLELFNLRELRTPFSDLLIVREIVEFPLVTSRRRAPHRSRRASGTRECETNKTDWAVSRRIEGLERKVKFE
jgi:hypothetical protein